MAKRTAVIKLEGVDYTIHAFNLDEIEMLSTILEGPKAKIPMQIIRLAMKRAAPKLDDVSLIEPEPGEIPAAVDTIIDLAGLKQADANPQTAPVAG